MRATAKTPNGAFVRRTDASLLDRLVDARSAAPSDPLLRDLGLLLNATRSGLGAVDDPVLAGSVLNYGVAPWAGRPASAHALHELAESIREAIVRFEPRLAASSVVVRPEVAIEPDRGTASVSRAVVFRIEAVATADPAAAPIRMRTEFDPDSGRVHRLEHVTGGHR